MMSCIPETPSVPDDVIPRDKMIDILEDVQVIEAVRQRGVILPKDMDPDHEAMRMYHRVFEEHQIKDSLFRKSFEWYEAHPKMLAEMYDEVLVRLSEEQALARQSLKPSKVKTDSTTATGDDADTP
jgi:hypothetical protein